MEQLSSDTAHKRQVFLIRAICLFWFMAKLITYSSWIADRDLPTVALFPFLDKIPQGVHLLTYAASMLLLAIAVVRPVKQLLALFMVTEVFLVLLDVLRVQPWEYLYLFITAFYLFIGQQPRLFYKSVLLILASTYIFSGLHKLGGAFLHSIWDGYFLRKIFGYQPGQVSAIVHYSGLFIGLGEFFSGMLLLFLRKKKVVVAVLMLMHIILVIAMGTLLGSYINSIIPWNIMMIVFLLYIANYPQNQDKKRGAQLPLLIITVIAVFWYILPFSNIFGFWAHPLSSGMYTGKVPKVYICWSGPGSNNLDQRYFLKKGSNKICPEGRVVPLARWTHIMATQAPFPTVWYNERLCQRLREQHPADIITMYYSYYPYKEMKEIK